MTAGIAQEMVIIIRRIETKKSGEYVLILEIIFTRMFIRAGILANRRILLLQYSRFFRRIIISELAVISE